MPRSVLFRILGIFILGKESNQLAYFYIYCVLFLNINTRATERLSHEFHHQNIIRIWLLLTTPTAPTLIKPSSVPWIITTVVHLFSLLLPSPLLWPVLNAATQTRLFAYFAQDSHGLLTEAEVLIMASEALLVHIPNTLPFSLLAKHASLASTWGPLICSAWGIYTPDILQLTFFFRDLPKFTHLHYLPHYLPCVSK